MVRLAFKRLVCIAVLGMAVAGCETKRADTSEAITNSLYQLAVVAERNSDYAAAVRHFAIINQRRPESLSIAVALARNLRYSGASADAVRALEQGSERFGADPVYLLELGKAKLAAGKSRGALTALKTALAKDPENWEVQSTIGIAYDLLEDFENARAVYETALELSENNPAILNNMAISAALSGDLDRAISILKNATTAARHSSQIRQNLALFYGIKGDIATAETLARMDLGEEAVRKNLSIYSRLRKY